MKLITIHLISNIHLVSITFEANRKMKQLIDIIEAENQSTRNVKS